ncbi:MAG: hypothetical protein KDK70_05895, partial [Myxococcales bacterium]|nr:hypothetical protein [Myxococcales bacterium]
MLGDTPTGEIEAIVDLTGSVIPPSGFFTIAEGSFTIGPPPDLVAFINFENTDTLTHMLVGGLSALVSDNVDLNADGVFDITPWITVLDTVAMIHPASTELPYGPNNPTGGAPNCVMGPTCQEVSDGIAVPQQIYRCPDGDGTWQIGNIDPAAMPLTDTPGGPNACGGPICGDGMVDMGEDCDDGGESAT